MRRSISAGLILTCISLPAFAQAETAAVLDELHALPKPSQQSDLDTTRIVSVERTMAASAEERRSGLWQSWRVAVCSSCGLGNQRTVGEINAASEAYVRLGDRQLLGRPKTFQPIEARYPPQNQDRGTPRILISELTASWVQLGP